jgi:hypothetical protein
MDILRDKIFKIAIFVALVVAPFVFWLSYYGLARFSSMDLRKAVPWLRALRWVTWIPAMVLMFAAVVNDGFHYLFSYGCGLFSFFAGLSFSESWLKKRLNLDSDNA